MTVEERVWKWSKNTIMSHKRRGFHIMLKRKEIFLMGMDALEAGCEICGCIMTPTTSSKCQSPNEMSLDVINPEDKRLSQVNSQVICCSCNHGKMGLSNMEYIMRAYLIAMAHKDEINHTLGLIK